MEITIVRRRGPALEIQRGLDSPHEIKLGLGPTIYDFVIVAGGT